MFKWFGGSPPPGSSEAPSGPREVVTDDPLAIISLSLPRVRRLRHGKARRPKHIYAVSRVNPIFEDEEGVGSSSSGSCGDSGGGVGHPASPGQSGVGSSGYDSQAAGERTTSSSEFSDDAASPGVGGGNGRRPPPRAASSSRRPEQVYLAALAALASIPEGQVPVPVWPSEPPSGAVVGRPAQHAVVESPPPPPPPWRQQLWERLTESSDDDSRRSCCDLQPPTAPMPPAQTSPPPPPARCASSTSSSGYSDLSIVVPPSAPYLQKPDLAMKQEMALVRGSVRNAMIYGTLNRIKCASGLGVYEKLLGFWRSQQLEARLLSSSSSSSNDKTDGSTSSKASWQSFPSPTPSKKSLHDFEKTAQYQAPSQRPDFTLDVPTAERVKRKIEAAKRRRCWCQLSMSILGLIFFIVSVMAVSMMYTRGERMFGSL
ncbi:WAS/WASL-interacting protein family member 3 [Cloeon dipterum]|uniref:WAS/WASL-interacting protein family member 3 n=1 Tax=Cloeon dipterum TaxID=197152 RepID=UPI003220792B